MSRLGKKAITIPKEVNASFESGMFSAKGPKGEMSRKFKSDIDIKIENDTIKLTPKTKTKAIVSLWGTYASHIKNIIAGVTDGYFKELVLEGVGYRVSVEGNDLVLKVGFSHNVKLKTPEGLKVEVEKNNIKISGMSKEDVGSFAAIVRDVKKPEPYKGKGIRYADEVVKRKQGKKSAK